MRVLHLPTTVGGNPSGLSHQLRQLGIESEVWTITQNYLNYPADRVIADESLPSPVRALKAIAALRYVFGRWDVVHYNFGSTLFSARLPLAGRGAAGRIAARLVNLALGALQRIELGVLRMRGIPFFVHYQGDDARQGDYSLEHFEISIATQVPPGYYTPESDERKRRQIAFLAARAAGIYAVNPDLMHVLPPSAEFVPYGHIDLDAIAPAYTQEQHERLVFAHAPSNRRVKGTDLILGALDELRAEGRDFDVDLIEGIGNDEALARYAGADVVIDQLYAGWYGGVALEAMALGKPVVAYIREQDLVHLPAGMAEELPLLVATPTTITQTLRRILDMPRAELLEHARRSRAFAERWHGPRQIATRIANDYRRALGAEHNRTGDEK
ncbi:glycosyltransferase family 4 protein [Salinibacterium sp. ZJ70]|uniref:glycosyltransferase family 4 protein n=1 Tax=Salinibacterium sp. ZJ70 TaxID=2708084 RepID=UPI00141DE184|nr:glycosyltransferase family 4 protein [Salinibacterium sp. ZJ70]